jgi:acetoin utilization deacetylase AcuC-like enzyme
LFLLVFFVKIFFADTHLQTLPLGHRFPMSKYELLKSRVGQEMSFVELICSHAVSEGELALVHLPSYIDQVFSGTLPLAQQKEIGFPWSLGMVERARCSTGATIQAARQALKEGISGNLAGGTHHAYADKGGGFCVFNDVAVAARLLQTEHHRSSNEPFKVLILDLDVHQGNGTAKIFCDDATVFTVSLHGAKNFPFRKELSDLDVELPDGTQDDVYLAHLAQALETVQTRFKADFVFYLAGADPYKGDRLGRLSLSMDGLRLRDKQVFHWAQDRGIPLAFVMAGGYGHDMQETAQIQMNTFKQAYASWLLWQTHKC